VVIRMEGMNEIPDITVYAICTNCRLEYTKTIAFMLTRYLQPPNPECLSLLGSVQSLFSLIIPQLCKIKVLIGKCFTI
jgi:hypothetical protein